MRRDDPEELTLVFGPCSLPGARWLTAPSIALQGSLESRDPGREPYNFDQLGNGDLRAIKLLNRSIQ